MSTLSKPKFYNITSGAVKLKNSPRFSTPNIKINTPLKNDANIAKSTFNATYCCIIIAIIAVGPEI